MAAFDLYHLGFGTLIYPVLNNRVDHFVFRSNAGIRWKMPPGWISYRSGESFSGKLPLRSGHKISLLSWNVCTKTGTIFCFVNVNNACVVWGQYRIFG